MCGTTDGSGLTATLGEARDFYMKSGQVTKPAAYGSFLSQDGLAAAFGTRCP